MTAAAGAETVEEVEGGTVTAASPAAMGEKNAKISHARSKKKRKSDHHGSMCKDDESTRRRHFGSQIDMSLLTYPGFFWVDRIPPQAGAQMNANARSSSDNTSVGGTNNCSLDRNVGKECLESSVECASIEILSKKAKSSPSPAGNKSPTRRISPKRAAKQENSSISASKDATNAEAERTLIGRSQRTRESVESKTASPAPRIIPTVKYGRWKDDELKRLAEGIRTHRYQWKKVAAYVRTRTPNQCKVKNEELIAAQIDSWPKKLCRTGC